MDRRGGREARGAGAAHGTRLGENCQPVLVSWPSSDRGSPAFAGTGDFPSAVAGITGEFVRDAEDGLSNPPIVPS